jgi:acyl-CoA synthetase (AMP-forming)/AMP-acid ligase II
MTAEVIVEAPASFVQERMFTEEQIYDTCALYTIGSGLRLAGTLIPQRLRAAMSAVIRRHEILRTSFRLRGDGLVQVIHPSAEPDLTVHDLRQASPESRVEAAEELIRRAQDRAFSLDRPPLWRALLFVLSDDESWLVFTLHHIVIDGWALARLWHDVRDAYESPRSGLGDAAPARYAEYARWERGRDDDAFRRSLAYWQERLAEPAPPLNLPFDRPRGANRVYRGALYKFAVPPELVQALRTECTRRRTTPFVVLLAAYVALLRRYCDQADLRIGVPLANRMRPETRELIGPLINLMPLCLTVDDEMTFDAVVKQARLASLEALEHQEVPLNLVTRQVVGQAAQPLYQALFTVQPPPEPTTRFSGVPAAPLDLPAAQSARADIELLFLDGDAMQGHVEYSTEVFDSATIERMAANFLRLLAGAIDSPHRRIHELPLLAEQEEAKVRHAFPRSGPAQPGVLHHLVDRVAAQRPVDGVETYIFDRRLCPVPIGVAGELYLGGAALTRDYLGRPGLPAERFVPHPFADRPGQRLYATGDRVRWLPDGSIDFLGRFDDQVKIRGFWVEPGEIAAVLSDHPRVRGAAAVVRTEDDAGPVLVGYVVPAEARDADGGGLSAAVEAELIAHCRARLPDFMVPRHLVAIDAVPLTGDGKVDRRALPEPHRRVEEPFEEEIRTPAESILTGIWMEVLGVPAVGLDEDFFDAGGDSLAVLRVVAAADESGLKLTAQDLYRLGTIRSCAAEAEAGRATGSG